MNMDLDGRMTPWYGVEGIVPISLEVQRTIKGCNLGFIHGFVEVVSAVRDFLG